MFQMFLNEKPAADLLFLHEPPHKPPDYYQSYLHMIVDYRWFFIIDNQPWLIINDDWS